MRSDSACAKEALGAFSELPFLEFRTGDESAPPEPDGPFEIFKDKLNDFDFL